MEKTRMVHRSIMAAFCTLLATTSAKAAVVTLHPLPALSTVPSRATGIADVDSDVEIGSPIRNSTRPLRIWPDPMGRSWRIPTTAIGATGTPALMAM